MLQELDMTSNPLDAEEYCVTRVADEGAGGAILADEETESSGDEIDERIVRSRLRLGWKELSVRNSRVVPYFC